MNATPANVGLEQRSSRTPWVAPLLLLLAVGLAYLGSFAGAFVFDDIPAIVENPTLRHPENLAGVLFPPGDEAGTVGGRPLVNLSLALNYAVGGTQPWGYHLFNLIIHAAATLLLFGLVRRTLFSGGRSPRLAGAVGASAEPLPWQSPWSDRDAMLLAFFASLLWAVHPLQTEAVTYVVQRAESLMGMFYLLTLYCFVRFAGSENGHAAIRVVAVPHPQGRPLWGALAVLACLLGMAAKEVMVSAPLVVLLYDRTFVAGSARGAWRRRRGFYLGLGATWLLLAGLVLSTHGRGGSAGFASGAGVWPYLLTQVHATVQYLRLALWPDRLVFDYGTALILHLGEVLESCLLLGLLVAGTLVALCRRYATGFTAFCFFAVLAPSSSFVPIATEPMAEHRMYLSLAAVSILGVTGVFAVLTKLIPRFARLGLIALGVVAAIGLGAATGRRNLDYQSEIALWSDTVRKVPGNARAHNNLAEAFRAAGQPEQAAEEFVAAARAEPDYAPAQYNLGVTLLDSGHPAEAIAHLEKALSAPRHQAELRIYLGEALARVGQNSAAADRYREALQLAPGNAEAAFGLGNNLAAGGRYADAAEALRLAATLAPDQVRIRNNLANALLFSGRVEEAIIEYREALQREPNNEAIRENLDRALKKRPAGNGF
jgi:tetratricopeptide (TPR) repeat protein